MSHVFNRLRIYGELNLLKLHYSDKNSIKYLGCYTHSFYKKLRSGAGCWLLRFKDIIATKVSHEFLNVNVLNKVLLYYYQDIKTSSSKEIAYKKVNSQIAKRLGTPVLGK